MTGHDNDREERRSEERRSRESGWQRWQVWTALIMLAISLGAIVFRAGGTDAVVERRLTTQEMDIQQIRKEYARQDVIDERLKRIEETESRIEKSEEAQATALNDLIMNLRRKN